MYAWRDAVAATRAPGDASTASPRSTPGARCGGAGGSERQRRRRRAQRRRSLRGDALGAELRTRALVGGFPLAVAALNRAGLGPLRADISSGELRRAGLRAMGEVAARLGLGDALRRLRPHPPRRAAARRRRRRVARRRAARAWLSTPAAGPTTSIFLTDNARREPYWPGTCVL